MLHAVWQHFYQITQIPRPSKHEGRSAIPASGIGWYVQAVGPDCLYLIPCTCRILQHLKDLAGKRGLKCKQDATGNLVIYRPGSGGGEQAAPVVIQASWRQSHLF